jgi:hypothetical protein
MTPEELHQALKAYADAADKLLEWDDSDPLPGPKDDMFFQLEGDIRSLITYRGDADAVLEEIQQRMRKSRQG